VTAFPIETQISGEFCFYSICHND